MAGGREELRQFKLVIVGDEGVGKSQIVEQFCYGTFSEGGTRTIGVGFAKKKTDKLEFFIWDTGGNERYRTLLPSYYRASHAVILAFDLSKSDSLANLKEEYLNEIRGKLEKDVPIFLVGTKSDLVKNQNLEARKAEALAFVQANGLAGYYETSAKENKGVQELFDAVGEKVLANAREDEAASEAKPMGNPNPVADVIPDFSFNPFQDPFGEPISENISIPRYAYAITNSIWTNGTPLTLLREGGFSAYYPRNLRRAGLVDWCTLFVPALTVMLLSRLEVGLSWMAASVYYGTYTAANNLAGVGRVFLPLSLVLFAAGSVLAGLLKIGSLAFAAARWGTQFVHSAAALVLTAVLIPFVAVGRGIKACFSGAADGGLGVSRGGSYKDFETFINPSPNARNNADASIESKVSAHPIHVEQIIKEKTPNSANDTSSPPMGLKK